MQPRAIVKYPPALQLTRTLDAPVDLAWKVITEPEHVSKWWGPDGFRVDISKMDVKPGGEWNLVLRGPDGTDFDNRIIYSEVDRHKKLVLQYLTTPKHTTTITFEGQGDVTLITWHMTFESEEQLTQLMNEFQVDRALEQNVGKWNQYLVNFRSSSFNKA